MECVYIGERDSNDGLALLLDQCPAYAIRDINKWMMTVMSKFSCKT